MNVRAMIVSVAASAVLALSGPQTAQAQDLGTFRWQLGPYCNVITLHATQKGNVFEVTGWDDDCGGPQRGGVFGSAFVNPDGSIGLAFTTIYSDVDTGNWYQQYATLDPGTLSGTWADDGGDGGSFTFLGAASVTPGQSATSGLPRRPRK